MYKKEPLYEKIINDIKEKIERGELTSNQLIPTELELAEKYNVSRITSRRALNELDREGIIYRKRKLGSFVSDSKKTDSIARESLRSVKVISMVLPFDSIYGSAVQTIKGATDILAQHGYFLAVSNASFDIKNEIKAMKKLEQDGASGIIYYPASDSKNFEYLTNLTMKNYPIVTIDKYFDGIPLSSVVSDNFNGGNILTKHLLDQGHKRIAFLSDVEMEESSTIRNRYLGYCNALKDYGVNICEDYVKLGYGGKHLKVYENDLEGGYIEKENYFKDLILNLLDLNVTAIQAVNDVNAVFIEKACLELGIKIPQQIALVGFDNIGLSGNIEIPITTVEQNLYEIGKRAAEIILKIINSNSNQHIREIVPVTLIKRASSMNLLDQIDKQAIS